MIKINFNELNMENIGQWPVVIKLGVLVIVFSMIFAIGYWLIIQGNFEQYDSLQGKEAGLKTDLENKQRKAYNLQNYRKQLEVMQERFSTMLKQLPAKNEMPGLLEEISKTGVAEGLKFDLFAPQTEIAHDFYYELPIKISVVGTFFQLAAFLSRVAEMNRIVTLHDFTVTGVAETDQKNKDAMKTGDELVMNITAKIYRYRTK